MARETDAWQARLAEEAKATGVDALMDALPLSEFFRVELGLFFLTRFLPGQPASVLRKVLDGYLSAGAGRATQLRNLRRRMGPTARSGQWRIRLNEYCQVPEHLRMFELDSLTARRVVPGSVFRARGSAVLPDREQTYQEALDSAVAYQSKVMRSPAPAGSQVWFTRKDQSIATLRVPDWIEDGGEPAALHAHEQRTRRPFPPVTEDDARQAAKEMDYLLRDDPRFRNENFSGRLDKMVFSRVGREEGCLTDGLGVFSIDGVAHVVGLMNSGKTTFNDILVKIAVDQGLKVGYLVNSVGSALAKVRFFRALGIRAVPLIGRRSRSEHIARYWDDQLYSPAQQHARFPEQSDAAAEFATDLCPLEMLLDPTAPLPQPLTDDERPCRDTLRVVGAKRGAQVADCPLISACPTQSASRQVPDAQVWVTTPAALLAGAAEPATYKGRWITAAQHELDFLVVDEADQVMSQFDTKFLHHQPLTHPDGWSGRNAVAWHEALANTWYRALAHKHGQNYHRHANYHSQALAGLLPLLMLPSGQGPTAEAAAGEALAEIVDEGPFSGHTLLSHLSRLLHGIDTRSEREEESPLWEAAEQYFDEHFSQLTQDPFAAPEEHLAPLIDTMTAAYTAKVSAQDAAEAWLIKHKPQNLPDETAGRVGELARLLIAGCWSARVTTSFFQLSAMQDSARELAPLEDTGSILTHQAPAELRALVPEQPMGNMMALDWTPVRDGGGGSLDVLWLRGVGRWLIYHLHDMLACEGVEGPSVLLSSATSFNPHSAHYHIDITPTLILREPDDCAKALRESRLLYRPRHRPGHEKGIYVSGARGRTARQEAIRVMTDAVCTPDPGGSLSLLEQVRQGVDPDRRQALFVVLSTQDAETSAVYMNTRTRVRALHVVPDSRRPGAYGLNHRRIADFPATGADALVAPEGSAGRGHNMLNERRVAAIGLIFYLARLHPPPSDLSFPLAVLNSYAMRRLLDPYRCDDPGADPAKEVRALTHGARSMWTTMTGKPLTFRTLTEDYLRRAFVADQLNSLYQTTGRGLRGNVPVQVYLLDAAFAPRAADPRDRAADTERTSVLIAGRQAMRELLTDPGPQADVETRARHAIFQATWGLLGNLFETIDWG